MTTAESLEALAALSRKYGADPDYVFLGGGNTSFKTDTELFIKPSGVALATIQPRQFLPMEREALRKVFEVAPQVPPEAREEVVKNLQLAAVRPLGAGRPSVEAPVHEVIQSSPYEKLEEAYLWYMGEETEDTDEAEVEEDETIF